MDELRLVRPSVVWVSQRRTMRELSLGIDAEAGYLMRDNGPNDAAFVRELETEEAGVGLPAGFVPQTTFWLILHETTLVGEIKLRHYLTPPLEDRGGHIGYIIHPDCRRRGFGAQQLALVLPEARAIGLDRVLITCNSDNVGSARIIEANGGVLASETVSPQSGALTRRYWVGV
jgi:predicted acetyltransferase